MKACNIKVCNLINPIGIDNKRILISWYDEGGNYQNAFQIIFKKDNSIIFDTNIIKSNKMSYLIPFKIDFRERIDFELFIYDENNIKGEASNGFFETGINLDNKIIKWVNPETDDSNIEYDDTINNFAKTNVEIKNNEKIEKAKAEANKPQMDIQAMMAKAKAAGIDISKMMANKPNDTNPIAATKGKGLNESLEIMPYVYHKPASYLKKSFTVNDVKNSRLYITAKGLYVAYINGKRVTDAVLTPGSSTANIHLAVQTYDITKLLTNGENEILIALGDGWFRSTTGVDGNRNLFGSELGVYFEVTNNKEIVYISDDTMFASQNGPIRANDMQQGEVYDARLENITLWHSVKLDENNIKLINANNVSIVENERFVGKLITTKSGETVIDFSQNIAGYIEISVDAHEGDKITLLCGEALENGEFTQENFEDRARHLEGGTLQCIELICKEGFNYFKPSFTIMGFQYALVKTNIDLSKAKFVAIAVYSKMEQLSSFKSSNPMLNKLFENSVWSMKGNFCDVPTDCPTRERAGWTGDMGVFIDTGLMLMDCYPVVEKWLLECRVNQYDDGRIANIAPPNGKPTMMSGMLCQSSAWGDASIIVPYALYQKNQDTKILSDNYDMMQRWLEFLLSRASKTTSEMQEGPYAKYTVLSGMDYGEWCEPGSNPMMDMANPRKTVGTAYLARSSGMLAKIANILDKKEDALKYKEINELATKAYNYAFTNNGVITSTHQCDYVRPLQFNLLSQKDEKLAAKTLNEMVINNDYHLNTGFLSTPYLCGVLTKFDYVDTAYKLLLQDSAPSWLYEVKMGANTIWETWEGINKEGKLNASLNHYSYGAISGFLLKDICGINVYDNTIIIRPIPNNSLSFAKASYKSPIGIISSEWKYEENNISYKVNIPSNTNAILILPDGRKFELKPGEFTI